VKLKKFHAKYISTLTPLPPSPWGEGDVPDLSGTGGEGNIPHNIPAAER